MSVPAEITDNGSRHVCAFYSDKSSLIELLVPYFLAGILNGDSCLWIVSGVIGVNDAFESIERAALQRGVRADRGQVEVHAFDNWYLHNGVFQADRVKNAWRERLSLAIAGKHRRLRVTGDVSWLDPGDWDRFLKYEDEINREFVDEPFTVVCTYPLSRTPRARIDQVLARHQFGVIKQHGEWGVV